MSQDLIKLFRSQLGNKRYDELETTWLELLASDLPFNELMNLAELAIRWAPKERTVTLLWVLADFCAENNRFAEEMVALRRLVQLNPDDEKLPKALTRALHNLYPDEALLEKILPKSGLGYGEPLASALTKFDTYCQLLPGKMVYDVQRGPGTIKHLDLLLDRVTIAFDQGATITIDLPTASKQLQPLSPDGFFGLLKNSPAKIQELARQEPGKLVLIYLKDINQPVTAQQIKSALESIIGKDEYAQFWEKAKKELTNEPHIAITPGANRAYRYLDQPQQKPPTTVKQKTKSRAESALSSTQLADKTSTEIINLFQELNSVSEKKQLLDRLITERPDDWHNIYTELFLLVPDHRTCITIRKRLMKQNLDAFQQLIETILINYRNYPDALIYIAERFETVPARQLITRLLDIIETDPQKNRRSTAKKILTAQTYHLIRKALTEMEQTEALRLKERIKGSRVLEPFHQDEINNIIAQKFTQLNQPHPSEVIYNTYEGIEQAKQQLQHLTQVELPKSAEEIARARAFGDLSENYEYKAAKEKQARLMQQINQLQSQLSRAQPIDPFKIDTSQVNVGCQVELTGEDGDTYLYSILGPWDAKYEQGIISYLSPFAQQLLGKKTGETVKMGDRELKITKITRAS